MDANEGGSDVSSLFYSPVVGPGQDRFLLLAVTTLGPTARVVSASYGVEPLTFYGDVLSPAGNCRVEWWGLVAPAEGANPLRLSLATMTANLGVTTITYTGVDQQHPTGIFVPASGPAGPTSVTVPSAPGEVVLDGVCGVAPDADIDQAGPGQSARWHWVFGPHRAAGSEKPGASPATTLTWTANGAGMLEWAAAGLSLRPTGAPLPPVKLDVDTAGCAMAGEKAGSGTAALPILIVVGLVAATRRRRGPRPR
jgi:MYXO-CTERM domain-containing protein